MGEQIHAGPAELCRQHRILAHGESRGLIERTTSPARHPRQHLASHGVLNQPVAFDRVSWRRRDQSSDSLQGQALRKNEEFPQAILARGSLHSDTWTVT